MAIWGAAFAVAPRNSAKSASSLCWPSSVHTRICGGSADIVKTNPAPTANATIGWDSPAEFSAAIHDETSDPSEEYFSMRPVLKYATNTELSSDAATEEGSSPVARFLGAAQDFVNRTRASNFAMREPA